MSQQDEKRIPELDGLRGCAIALVLLFHYFVIEVHKTPGSALARVLVLGRLSWSGVDLFFVLSGFLIGGLLLDARASSNYFRVFYTRRFFRIVPIYAATLLLFPLLVRVAQASGRPAGNFAWLRDDPLPWYSFWTFTQNFWMAAKETFGANTFAVTWSLSIEEQFYLTLPLLVRFAPPRILKVALVAGVYVAPAVRSILVQAWPNATLPPFVLMPCRMDALLLGVLAAVLVRDPRWRDRLARAHAGFAFAFAVLLAGMAFLTVKSPGPDSPLMMTVGYTWLGLFYVAVLLYAVTRPRSMLSRVLRTRALRWLGRIAYGTYLLHQMVRGLIFACLWGTAPQLRDRSTLLATLAAVACTLIVAKLSWRFFEEPLVRRGHRTKYAAAVPPASS